MLPYDTIMQLNKVVFALSSMAVYRALSTQKGEYLSGQELSRQLGISRAAVWKAVESLRKQGYKIEACTGRGYRLVQDADLLTPRTVHHALTIPRQNITVLDTVDSTNTACKLLAMEGAEDGTVVIADHQSAGRGRMGRSFQSPAGLGLYLSILWRPDCTPDQLMSLTALSAVAAGRAIQTVTGILPQIKWPNDLVLHGKKIAGILTEMGLEGETGHVDYAIVGIGINCHHTPADFADGVSDMASSLDELLHTYTNRALLAAALIEQLDFLRRSVIFSPQRWLTDYRENCLTLHKQVRIMQTGETVLAVDVDSQYGLIVQHTDGTQETCRAGEVSVRGLYGYTE